MFIADGSCTIDLSEIRTAAANGVFLHCSTFRQSAGSITINGNKAVSGIAGIGGQRSRCVTYGNIIANNCAYGISSYQVSNFYVANLAGTNNNIGLRCIEGSTIAYNNKTISASTAQTTATGGRIYSGS